MTGRDERAVFRDVRGVARIKDFVKMDSAAHGRRIDAIRTAICWGFRDACPCVQRGPRTFESARMRVSCHRGKPGVWGARGTCFRFCGAYMPRMMLPADFSASWRDGKAPRRLRRSGSPRTRRNEGTRQTIEKLRRNFLRTKAATDSSITEERFFQQDREATPFGGSIDQRVVKKAGGLRGRAEARRPRGRSEARGRSLDD